jgi:toxin CcdB
MAGFDVHRLSERDGGGLVVDVQSDLIDVLDTRVVVPLMPAGRSPKRADRLNPVFVLPEGEVALFPQFIAALPRAALGRPVGSLAHGRDRIRAALDMLFLGF